MSKERQLTRRPSESDTPLAQDTFDLTAMRSMAEKIKDLKVFMEKNLEQGLNKDWEYAHIIWKRELRKGDDAKPCLLDPGVAKIMNFMTVRPRHRIIEKEIDTQTMQLRYVVAVEIVPFLPIMYHNPVTNAMEPIYPVIAEGLGSATTREKRYKVRFEWMKERDLKVEGWTADELKRYTEENPDKYKEKSDPKYDNLYYMPTAESLGLDNTLLKMAAKRGNLDAVFQLPGVAGRYSQEADKLSEEESATSPSEKERSTPPLSAPLVAQGPVSTPPSTPTEEPRPAEKPSLKSVDLNDPVERVIADIQAVNRGLSRAQIVAKIGEEKAKAAGLLTDEAAAYLVASTLGVKQSEDSTWNKVKAQASTLKEKGIDNATVAEKDAFAATANQLMKEGSIPVTPGFKSASELPKMPDTFRLGEKAAYTADYIVESYSQQPDAVRAMIYAEMQESHLSDSEAAAQVQRRFNERSEPPEEKPTVEEIETALSTAGVDPARVNISPEADEVQPKKFLGDDFMRFNDTLKPLGFEWISDGKNSRWVRKG